MERPGDGTALRGHPGGSEDAYQHGLEILLTKAPTTREDELVPWLKRVAIRTIRPLPTNPANEGFPHDRGWHQPRSLAGSISKPDWTRGPPASKRRSRRG